mgnify:FL=1
MTQHFKGNFGELEFNVNGNEATGSYQKNGTLQGQYADGQFEGTWTNMGMEGRIAFTIADGHLKGTWKKGLEPGAMRGKWFGDLVSDPSEREKIGFVVPTEETSETATPQQDESSETQMIPDFPSIEYSEHNILACSIAALTRHMIVADRVVTDNEAAWMQDVLEHYDAQGIPVRSVWDEIDDRMQILESIGAHAGVLERSAEIIKVGLDDKEKNFLLNAFQNIVAQDDVVTYEEFQGLSFTLEQWYPGKTDQMIENFKKSGIRLDF